MLMRDTKTPSLTSLERALRIYEEFAQSDNALGVSEISRNLKMKKAAVHRVLITLERSGYLEKDQKNQKYNIGPKILIFVKSFRDSSVVRTIAIPFMENLQLETGETVGLHVAIGNNRCCIKDFESKHVLRSSLREGYTVPIYMGSVGRVLMAGMNEEQLNILFNSNDYQLYAPERIKNFKILKEELEQTLINGYAISHGERTPGVWSISSPIFDSTKLIIAALSLSIPEVRINNDIVEEYKNLVCRAADRISANLGYQK